MTYAKTRLRSLRKSMGLIKIMLTPWRIRNMIGDDGILIFVTVIVFGAPILTVLLARFLHDGR